MDPVTPAAVPPPAQTAGAAPAVAPEAKNSPVASTPTPAQPEASTAAKLDIQSVLADENALRELMRHERVQQEIQHRAKSEAGRVVSTLKQQEAQFQQRKSRLDMDSFELGEKVKSEILEEDRTSGVAAQVYGQFAKELATSLQGRDDLTEQEKQDLHPANPRFRSFGDYFAAVVDAVGKKEGAKLAKTLAKVEAQALVANERVTQREGQKGPATNLPAGSATTRYTRESIAKMTPEEYAKNRDDIFAQLYGS